MNKRAATWVVYQKLIHGRPTGINAVCEQPEWDEMERLQPGVHTLVQAGITNEGEAERLARGPDPVKPSRKPIAPAGAA